MKIFQFLSYEIGDNPKPELKPSAQFVAKQYLQRKRLLSALLYFSVTKSGASESRYDLTKPGTPLIDLGSQVVSIEPQEKCFQKISSLPNPFPLDVWWLALDLCSWNKDDPIVDMSCHARISGPLGKFYSISIPF